MPFIQTVNNCRGLGNADRQALIREFEALRTELDEMRANFNAVLTKLDSDAGVSGTDYSSLNNLSTSGAAVTSTTAAAARRFTKI